MWMFAGLTAFASPTVWQAPDGLQVVLDPHPEQDQIAVSTLLPVGATTPSFGPEAAHLAEHLWFRVPTDRGDVRAHLDSLGCAWNAFTALDRTVFEQRCPSAAFDELLALEERRFTAPLATLDATSIHTEQAVVSRESAERTWRGSRPFRLLAQHLAGVASPEGEPPTTPAAWGTWAHEHWRRGTATVVLVGRFDPSQVIERWSLEPAQISTPQTTIEPRDEPGAHEIEAPGDPRVLVGWALPSDTHPAVPEALARLADRAVYVSLGTQPWVEETKCASVTLLAHVPALMCGVSVRDEARLEGLDDKIARAVEGQLGVLRRNAVRDRVHAELTSHAGAEAWKGAQVRATELAERVHGGRAPDPTEVAPPKASEVMAWARGHLTAARMEAVVVRPGELSAPVPEAPATTTPGPSPDLASLGEVTTTVAEHRLKSGLRVVIATVPGVEGVAASAVVGGGGHVEPFGVAHYAAWFTRTPHKAGDTALVLDHQLLPDATIRSVHGPSGSLAAVLDHLDRDLRHRLVLEWSNLREIAEPMQGEVLHDWSDPRWWARRLRWNRVNPKHRLLFELGIEELAWMAQSPTGKVRRYLEQVHAPQNVSLVVVSGAPVGPVLDAVEATFGKWRGSSSAVPSPAPPSAPAGPATYVLEGVLPDAEIALTCPLPARGYAPRVIRRAVFDALYETLRSQRGLIYTPQVHPRTLAGGSAMLDVEVRVGAEQAEVALGLVEASLHVSAERLAHARQLEAHHMQHELTEAARVLDVLGERIRLGWPVDRPESWPVEISTLDPIRLEASLAECRQARSLTLVLPDGAAEPERALEPVDWRAHRDAWLDRAGVR